ncbi:hypothetical protein [Neisseria iguanae]|nr:hypothetical protein [Neisseria iguanae]
MYKITDALALGYVLSIMDPDLTLERLNFFLNRVGNRAANSLEILLDQVRKMLLGKGVAETQVGDISDNADSRQNYHQHLHELKEYLEKSGRNYCFKEISFEKALEDSDEGLAMRYALKALNPFVFTGMDYSRYNADGYLSLFSQENPNSMTESYPSRRMKMLEVKTA